MTPNYHGFYETGDDFTVWDAFDKEQRIYVTTYLGNGKVLNEVNNFINTMAYKMTVNCYVRMTPDMNLSGMNVSLYPSQPNIHYPLNEFKVESTNEGCELYDEILRGYGRLNK